MINFIIVLPQDKEYHLIVQLMVDLRSTKSRLMYILYRVWSLLPVVP